MYIQSFFATAIMRINTYTAPAAVPCAFPGVVVVIQLAKEIPNTFSYRAVTAIIMSQTLQ